MTSITILSFNRKDAIKACLTSLYKFTDNKQTPFEVIIIDQNSNNETKQFLRGLKRPNLKVVFLEKNIGCASGRKKAFQFCSRQSDFIFQSDNDIIFTNNWLKALLRDIELDPRLGALQSRSVSPNGRLLLAGGIIKRFTINGKSSKNGYLAYFKDSGATQHAKLNKNGFLYCDYVSGGVTLFRRKLLENVPYNTAFLNGYEDYDLSLRARKMGWKLACDHNVRLIHYKRHFMDGKSRKKEEHYINTRENNKTLLKSLLVFIRIHNMNPVRSDGFDAIIKDDKGNPFSEYSDAELKDYFDRKNINDTTKEN